MRWHRPTAASRALFPTALLAIFWGGVLTCPVIAQPPPPSSAFPNPQLLTVTPPGGKAGSVVEVSFTGTDLEEPESLVFSTPSIKAEPVIPPAPPADPKKPAKPAPAAKPVITQFKVTIPANTPLGIHDVRLVNKWGISNPRAFVVGDLPEILEKEPNNNDTEAQKVPLNCTVNGVIAAPTDVDYYTFPGTKGQRVVIHCLALSIDSRLQPFLQLYDSKARQLAANYRYQGNRHYMNSDALVDCTLPEDGDYFIRISHFTYTQGDAQHYYRLTISTAPWIDAIHPAVVEPGKTVTLTVHGRNLPGGKLDPATVVDGRALETMTVTVSVPNDAATLTRLAYSGYLGPAASMLDGFEYRVRNSTGASNPYLLTLAKAPVVVDNGVNDTPETAQEVSVPCEIAGRIEKRHDRDWYVFTAKKGEIYNFEVLSDRLEAPTDMYFVLHNPTTKQDIAEGDDNPDVVSTKFFSRSDDPTAYRFVVPADGKYQLLVSSRMADTFADIRHIYRVRVTPDQADFRLVAMPMDFHRPDSCCLLQGGCEAFTIYVWRQDGFKEDVQLSVDGLPKGITCAPQVLAGGQRTTTLVLSAAADAPVWTGEIKIKGMAVIKGQPVVREARSASIVWPVPPQQNIPTVTRLDRSVVLAVREKAPFNMTATLDKTSLLQGDKATLTVKLSRLWPDFKKPLTATFIDPVPNLVVNNNQPITLNPGKDTIAVPVVVNPAMAPGIYNLVLRGQAPVPFNKDPAAKQKPEIAVLFPSTPVVLEVLPKTVATINLAPNPPTVKVGMQTEVILKVARQFNYEGEFKVQVIMPPSAKGLSAADAIIPPGKDEVKLVFKAAADAGPGTRADLLVKATAMVNGKVPTVHEVKFSVNVVK